MLQTRVSANQELSQMISLGSEWDGIGMGDFAKALLDKKIATHLKQARMMYHAWISTLNATDRHVVMDAISDVVVCDDHVPQSVGPLFEIIAGLIEGDAESMYFLWQHGKIWKPA